MNTYKFTISKPHGSGNRYYCYIEVYATNEEKAKVALQTYCSLEGINLEKYTIDKIEQTG